MCGLILICHNRFDGGGLTTTTKTTSAIDRSAAQRKRREMQAEKGKNGEIREKNRRPSISVLLARRHSKIGPKFVFCLFFFFTLVFFSTSGRRKGRLWTATSEKKNILPQKRQIGSRPSASGGDGVGKLDRFAVIFCSSHYSMEPSVGRLRLVSLFLALISLRFD